MTASHRVLVVAAVLGAVAFGLPWSGAVPTASAQTISVTAADPPTGEQGTLNLNVIIKGKGFKNGAKANFFKTGTSDPAGVNVKSTRFVSSTQLIALVDIADTAALSLFDIQVANTDGRTGKGTELFTVVQKGNLKPEYEAEFVEFKPEDPTWTPMIRGDGLGPYSPVNMDFGGGGFETRMDLADGRGVWFQFSDPNRTFQSTLSCEAWFTRTPYARLTPAYLLASDKSVLPDYVEMYTSYELVWDGSLSAWVRIVESVKGKTVLYHRLNLLTMLPGQKSYSMFYLRFKLEPSRDYFLLNFNDTFYRELVPSGGTTKLNGGIVEVERPGPEEIWYIRPISSRFPVLGTPPTQTVQYQANHAIYDVMDEMGDTEGNCDLGSYLMRFELRIARK